MNRLCLSRKLNVVSDKKVEELKCIKLKLKTEAKVNWVVIRCLTTDFTLSIINLQSTLLM